MCSKLRTSLARRNWGLMPNVTILPDGLAQSRAFINGRSNTWHGDFIHRQKGAEWEGGGRGCVGKNMSGCVGVGVFPINIHSIITKLTTQRGGRMYKELMN